MGRYVRPILQALNERSNIALTLLVREPRVPAQYRAILGAPVELAPVSAARTSRSFDCVWYPWNGMPFRSRVAALVTINDDFAFRYPAASGAVARWREQWPVQRAIRKAAHILTISHWSRRALLERFGLPPDRISLLPLEPDRFFSIGSDPSPFGAEPFVLVVGAGEERKNIPFLIGVFAAAFPAGDVRLVIVGTPDGKTAARLRTTTAPVTILARVDDEVLRQLYRTAAAVAVPSQAEGFGLVAAEAQACGAAVIVARTSGLPEAIGAAGVAIAADRDAELTWTQELRRLVRDDLHRATYQTLAAARWRDSSAGPVDALLVALERMLGNRM